MAVCARKLQLMVLIVAIGPFAFATSPTAAKSVTVAQLDELIGQLKGQNDSKSARHLTNLILTERASFSQLTRWESNVPGNRTREALLALVDASAFLPAPVAERVSAPAPDDASRGEILVHVTDYVTQSAHKLPNFLAARSTVAFAISTEDQMGSDQQLGQLFKVGKTKRSPFHALGPADAIGGRGAQLYWLGSYSQTVAYRDGAEVDEGLSESSGGPAVNPSAMTSVGEFGQMLTGLFKEISPEELVWDHWEQGAMGRVAVFDFSVSRDRSRFALSLSANERPVYPAHRGQLEVDPVSGAILRISLVGQFRDVAGPREAGVVLEFAPTEIGGRSYICAIHSVASFKAFDTYADLDTTPPPIPTQTTLNDVSFTEYRVFGSTSRIISGAKEP